MTSVTASSGTDGDDGFHLPDYVHILLLSTKNAATRRVLMLYDDSTSTWDLPFISYPDSLRHNGDRCAADLELMLSVSALPDRRAVTVVAELLGSYGGAGLTGDDPVGFARLILVEPQIMLQDMCLPQQAQWKDACFVTSLLESLDKDKGNYPALEVTLQYLHTTVDRIAEHPDPRYRFGWFNDAANWLRTEVERHGDVPMGRIIQEHVSSTSSLLSLKCSLETYYLKAPALGCEETSISASIASLFPGDTADVVATSDKLHSFIMRGFAHVEPRKAQYGAMVMALGNIQLQSLQHLETLKSAGCENRGPKKIAKKLLEWTTDEDMKQIFGFEFENYVACASKVMDLCAKLTTYKIPLTLAHGDFDTRNTTVLSEPHLREESSSNCDFGVDGRGIRIQLFDWQYACISHPFFDLHELHETLSDVVLNAYLDLWTAHESRHRICEAFEIAKHLGWCLKMWTSMNCFKACNVQRKSSTAEFLYDAFTALDSGISNIKMQSRIACAEAEIRLVFDT